MLTIQEMLDLMKTKNEFEVDLTLLHEEEITEQNVKIISDALVASENISCIRISSFGYGERDPFSLAHKRTILNAILKKTNIVFIELYNFELQDGDIEILSKMPLLDLRLENCNINDNKVQILTKCKSLVELRITQSSITNEGVKCLVQNKTIKRLALRQSQIGLKGLLDLLKANSHEFLYAAQEHLDISDLEVLEKALEENTFLEEFPVYPRGIGSKLAQSKFLERNKKRKAKNKRLKIYTNYKDQHVLYDWCFQPSRSDQTFRQVLLEQVERGFDPNVVIHTDNPYINPNIFNEFYDRVIDIIQTFPGILDPNCRDYQGKNALIAAAKLATLTVGKKRSKISSEVQIVETYPGKKHAFELYENLFNATDVVLALLKTFGHKLDINAQDHHGCTALHYVSLHRNHILIQALLGAGAKILMDFKGKTPLDYAKMTREQANMILTSECFIEPHRDSEAIANGMEHPLFPPSFSCVTTLQNLEAMKNFVYSQNIIKELKSLEEIEGLANISKYRSEFEVVYVQFKNFLSGKSVEDIRNDPQNLEIVEKMLFPLEQTFPRGSYTFEQIKKTNSIWRSFPSYFPLPSKACSIIFQYAYFGDCIHPPRENTIPTVSNNTTASAP